MKLDIYIKLIILFVCVFLIYSTIVIYRYNVLTENGLKTIQAIHKKNIKPEDFTAGFTSAEENFKKAALLLTARDEANYYLATLYIDYINSEFERKLAITEHSGLTEDFAEKEAIARLERAISLNPYNVDAFLSLAWLYEYAGRNESADRMVLSAESLCPGKLRVMQKVLEWAVLRRNMNKAKKVIEDIFTINPAMLPTSLNIVWRVEQDYEKLKELIPAKRKAREIFIRFLRNKKMDEEAKLEEEYAETLSE